ncbi:MAG: inorganic pyrophosphatase [SAR324 cluster bacterium]|nr:inorganic pyrophosphatase [SAR324 cluster bacterium]
MTDSSSFFRWRPHPWHGVDVGPNPPDLVHAFIEITPFDHIKYEVDKTTGYLRVDRPHRTSSLPPNLYGFIPRTYCGRRVGALMTQAKGGDEDPLDICVVSERPIDRAEVILNARVVGGIPMLDGGEADDKIIAVLENDIIWADIKDLSELPDSLIERIRHYFSTYKSLPREGSPVTVGEPYGREHAEHVVESAIADYREKFDHFITA